MLINTATSLVGVESKRFEPFRTGNDDAMSDTYRRREWGAAMTGYERLRDKLGDGSRRFNKLDAAQLIKHAFALRTAVHKVPRSRGKRAVLYYLYAEPEHWPAGQLISPDDRAQHRDEITAFSKAVTGDEVEFEHCSYRELLAHWLEQPNEAVRVHAAAVASRFGI